MAATPEIKIDISTKITPEAVAKAVRESLGLRARTGIPATRAPGIVHKWPTSGVTWDYVFGTVIRSDVLLSGAGTVFAMSLGCNRAVHLAGLPADHFVFRIDPSMWTAADTPK